MGIGDWEWGWVIGIGYRDLDWDLEGGLGIKNCEFGIRI